MLAQFYQFTSFAQVRLKIQLEETIQLPEIKMTTTMCHESNGNYSR